MEFVEAWLGHKVDVEFIFNRDLPLNQADAINNCKNSIGVISKETVIANHPWTQNTADELKRIKEEEAQLIEKKYLHGINDMQKKIILLFHKQRKN